MRRFKILFGSAALLAGLALTPAAQTQVMVSIGVQPVCSWGYYDYAPYACAPSGFYGPGYFYNGIFLGMGPWAGWGYGHGWGSHRFVDGGGGSYRGNGGAEAARGHYGGGQVARASGVPAVRSGGANQVHGASPAAHTVAARPTAAHAAPRQVAAHSTASHSAPRASVAHSGGGGGGHAGGEKK
jgi:hypothetical protein